MDVTRALTARRLAGDLGASAALAAQLADEAVWDLTHGESRESHAAVALALGVSVPTVRKAIQQHNRRVKARGLTEGTDSDMQSSANGVKRT